MKLKSGALVTLTPGLPGCQILAVIEINLTSVGFIFYPNHIYHYQVCRVTAKLPMIYANMGLVLTYTIPMCVNMNTMTISCREMSTRENTKLYQTVMIGDIE